MRDHSANQRYPNITSFLWPNKSPRRPAGRMNVPTVREYAAGNQDNWPGFWVPNEEPMMWMGAMAIPRPA